MATETEAREKACCVMDKKCVASDCLGWQWTKWKAGMAAPTHATHTGPTQILVINGEQDGYCGRAGKGEYGN